MLILIFGSKSGFGDDLGQYDTNFMSLLDKRLLEIVLPWQHLRSQVIKNYLKLKVTKFQLKDSGQFPKNSWGTYPPPSVKNSAKPFPQL